MIHELKIKFGPHLEIVSSGSKNGADKYAKKYALELDCNYIEFNPAHTPRNLYSALHDSYYGKDYAPKWFFQSNKMLTDYIDYLVAFSDSKHKGVTSMCKMAEKKGKKVVIMT